MHASAMKNGDRFFKTYVQGMTSPQVVEIGARNVNGSLRAIAPSHVRYIGVDLAEAPGVDVVLADPYKLPFADESIDVVLSSSCFEHSEFFWESFIEIQRVLKSDGLLYMNVPSNGDFHRYPVDCWRFYPDSGLALARWARQKGYKTALLESYVGWQDLDIWNDQVCVYVKDEAQAHRYPGRITSQFHQFSNGLSYPQLDRYLNPQTRSQDQRRAAWWHAGQRVLRATKRALGRG